MTIKSTTDKPTTARTDTFQRERPRPVEVKPQLDRRAQRNLQNLGGKSSFSSPSLPTVSGTPRTFATKEAGPVAKIEQKGFDAIKTIREIQDGVATRTAALDASNEALKVSETRLAEDLKHLEHTLTPDELQAYADDFRADEPAYAEAEAAAQDLATYVTQNAPRLATAEADVRQHHPQPEAYETVLQGAQLTRRTMEDAALSLETHVALSPTGSPQLEAALGGIGVGMAAAVLEQTAGLAESMPRFKALAERAGGAFGVIGALADGKSALDGVLEDGNPEDYAALAANGVLVAQGVLKVAGVAVSAPVSMVAGAVAMVASGVSDYRENEERVADMTARLGELGIDPAHGETIARANPAAFEALAQAGYSTDQIRRLTALGDTTLTGAYADEARGFAAAARTLGLSPEEAVAMLEAAPAGLASSVAGYLTNAGAVSDGTAADLLRALRAPYPGSERQRELILGAIG